ncbi:peptide-methionine (S)-S-oxide reductase [Vibrio rumoiensis]|uniref:peptide-methionine (S)-S-oxide reductase n=1 Tax=Vibrio rumoiensis 1S-45 TaxID=1188252 RepID=A0A1E5E5E1_9VIBR|nr:peptide-methionine (S)-S-oxide reductase [Vibrio rumoiensis]OEF28136.1 hypothetical protein A1QC_05705 [Vibrio rumoiensis 1S-45]
MIKQVALSGSCYWCMEAIFQSLKGITHVNQGWIAKKDPTITGSHTSNEPSYHEPTYEAVLITYDPSIIPLEVIIDIHIHTHSSTHQHALRSRYPSAVYAYDADDLVMIETILHQFKKRFESTLLTQAFMAGNFIPSKQSMQDYFYSNPDKPFCQTIISPKLRKLMSEYASWVDNRKKVQLETSEF